MPGAAKGDATPVCVTRVMDSSPKAGAGDDQFRPFLTRRVRLRLIAISLRDKFSPPLLLAKINHIETFPLRRKGQPFVEADEFEG